MASQHSRNWLKRAPSWIVKLFVSWYPPLLGTGLKITEVAPDWKTVRIALRLRWYNKNFVGTHFGGSMAAVTDPFYMLMFIRILGDDYLVWDKGGSVEFKKPGRETLFATFRITEDELAFVKKEVEEKGKYVFDREIELVNARNEVIARVVRTLYIAKRKST